MADNFGRGLRVLGHQPSQPICMYADTRYVTFVYSMASKMITIRWILTGSRPD